MPHRCAASFKASKPSSTPSLPAPKARLESKDQQAIQVAPKVRKESKAMKGQSAGKACQGYKDRWAMMEPSARKESKAAKAKPARKESLVIQAALSAPKARLERMERMAATEPRGLRAK